MKSHIEAKFVELTARYMADVKKCVTDNYSKISGEAQKELEEVFNENDKGPQLQDVPFGFFERIKFAVLGRLPFNFVQEVFIKQYTKSFYDKLKGSKKEHGLFAKQCIVQPAKEYSKQITEWSNGYKQSIASTLNKDNAILSLSVDNALRVTAETKYPLLIDPGIIKLMYSE